MSCLLVHPSQASHRNGRAELRGSFAPAPGPHRRPSRKQSPLPQNGLDTLKSHGAATFSCSLSHSGTNQAQRGNGAGPSHTCAIGGLDQTHCSVASKGSGHCLVGWAQPCLGHHDCPSHGTHACGQSFSGNQGSGIL